MLDLDKLNYEERADYKKLLDQYKIRNLTIADMKESINNMLFSVVRELVELESNKDEQNTFLKARAKNYLSLLTILTAPEQAEKNYKEAMEALEKKIAG